MEDKALHRTLSIQSFGGRRPCFRVQGSEQESDEQEDQGEADTHKNERLHNEGVLLLVDQTIVDLCRHGLVLVDRQQVQIDELGLAKHELDVPVTLIQVIRADRAVQQIVAVFRVENLHVDQARVLRKL